MDYDSVTKNKIMPSAMTGMGLEIIIPSEVSQTEKDKYMSPPIRAAYDLILTEVDGKCPWKVPICS